MSATSPPPPPPPPPPAPPHFLPGPPTPRRSRWPLVLALVGLALIVVAAAVVAIVVVVQRTSDTVTATVAHHASAEPRASGVPTSPTATAGYAADQAARDSAIRFVEQAVPQMLSYDYRTYEQHLDEAMALMTAEYAASYRHTSDQLAAGVASARAAITTTVRDAALVGIGDDQAQVLVFLDERTEINGATGLQPSAATLSLRRANGRWLVDQVDAGARAASVVDEPDPRRAAVIAAATREASAFVNFDYRQADSNRDAVLGGATGEFADSYRSSFTSMVAGARRSRSIATGEVTAAGITTYDDRSATVLIATTGSRRSGAAPADPNSYRLQLTLLHVGGQWLVSTLTMIG